MPQSPPKPRPSRTRLLVGALIVFAIGAAVGWWLRGADRDAILQQLRALAVSLPVRRLMDWWLLILATLLLIPLLLTLRGDTRRFSLLKRCLLISLLIHLLLTVSFSLIGLSRVIVAYVREQTGMEVAINLDASREAQVALAIRNQAADLPVTPPPAVELERIELPRIASDVVVKPLELDVPRAAMERQVMRIETPQNPPRPDVTEAVALAAPQVPMNQPQVDLPAPRPIQQAEATPAIQPAQVPAHQRIETPVADVRVDPAVAAPQPVRVQADSLARALELSAAVPTRSEPVKVAMPAPVAMEVTATLPQARTASAEAPSPTPQVAEAAVAIARQAVAWANVTPRVIEMPAMLPATPLAQSMAGNPVAEQLRPRVAEPIIERTPEALVLPLSGPVGPQELPSARNLSQRSPEARAALVNKLGGTEQSEQAVERGLAYLARVQERDGRWTKIMDDGSGRRGRDRHDVAYTGLGALCFLGADHTPAKSGPYRQTVEQAMCFLLNQQKKDGDLRGGGDMYDHGIGAIALAEAAIMTGSEEYRVAAHKAADFIVAAQHRSTGGWRYTPGELGDTSVFGWQVMALHSAEQTGFELPGSTRQRAMKWINLVGVEASTSILAGYQAGREKTPAMTAEAVFSRVLLEDRLTPRQVRELGDFLLRSPPPSGPKDFYCWYYASLALMQFQGEAWERYNPMLRDHLVKVQRRGGALDGSWDYDDRWGKSAGRIYSTAMATLTLEVYYRFLPMYSVGHDKP